ncbi:DUF2339 domain-containing protein [Kibdelosporangium lantanae]
MDALLRLADEVGELGRRLDRISAELRTYTPDDVTRPVPTPTPTPPPLSTPAPAPAPAPTSAPVSAALPTSSPVPAPQPVPPYAAPPPHYPPYYQPYVPPPKGPSLVERLGRDGAGSRLLAWVGGAVTLLGVVLFLILAVQRGWLGPLPRVLVGAALGCALIGVGLWAHRSPNGRTGAFALAATGIAALYLDAVAATTLYDFLPEAGGLAVGLVVAVGGLLLAARWDAVALGTAVVVGCAACAPVITHGFTPELVTFLLVVQIATTPVRLRKTWPAVALAAGAPPLVASVVSTAQYDKAEAVTNAVVAVAALVVGAALAVVSTRRRADGQVTAGLLAWAAAPALLSTVMLTKWEAVTVAVVVAVVMLAAWVLTPLKAVAATATFVAAFEATAVAFDEPARSIALMGVGALLALVALTLKDRATLWGAFGFTTSGALLAFYRDVPPSLLVRPVDGVYVTALVSSLCILGVAVLLPWVAATIGVLRPAAENLLPWLAAGVAALYGAAGVVLSAVLLGVSGRSGFLLGHVLITVSWTVAALVLLLKGIGVRALRVTGLVLVGAAVLKLVLFDLSALDGMARVAAFLVAGLILLAAGTRYARLVSGQR